MEDGVSSGDVGVYVELDQTDHRNISLLRANSDVVSEFIVFQLSFSKTYTEEYTFPRTLNRPIPIAMYFFPQRMKETKTRRSMTVYDL